MSRASRTVKPPTDGDTSAGRAGAACGCRARGRAATSSAREAGEPPPLVSGARAPTASSAAPPRRRASPPAARCPGRRRRRPPPRGARPRRRRAPGRCRTRARARTRSRTCRRCCPRWRSRRDARRSGRAGRSSGPRAGPRSARPDASTTLIGPNRMIAATSGSSRGPGSHETTCSSTHSSTTGIARTSTAPSAIAPTKRYGDGQRSASAARPVADREARQDDADQRAPDVERAAERRCQHAARRDLDPEERGAPERNTAVPRASASIVSGGAPSAQG